MSDAFWSPPPVAGVAPVHPANLGRPALVLLAGMLGDPSLWDGIAGRLNDLARPWPVRIDLDDSIAELAASVLAAAPEQFVLAGHSLGGIVALEVQRRAPSRVRGLVLVNTSPLGPSPAQHQSWSELARRVEAGQFAAVADELARATLPPASDPGLLAASRAMAESVGPAGLVCQLSAQQSRSDYRAGLTEIGVPVLVLGGAEDTICPLDRQRELAAGCDRATLVELPGAGHMLPLERPEAVAGAIRDWWPRLHPAQ